MVRGTDNRDQKTRNHSCRKRHCRRRAIYWLLRSPSQTSHGLKLKSTGAGRYQLLSRWWDAYRKQLGLKDFSQKSQDVSHCSRLRSVALYLWLVEIVDDIRQAIDRCSNAIWASLPGAGYGQFEHKADSAIAKFKAGGTVREIDVWAESPAIISALVICIIVCLSWAINHYRDNAITYKAQRDKTKNARELKLAKRGNWCTVCRCVSVMLLRSWRWWTGLCRCKLMLKLKMMLCVMMLPLVVVGCHIKAVCQSVREATTASGVDNAASILADTIQVGLFHPQREADHYAKTTGRNPEV